jgi:hypothetical protein
MKKLLGALVIVAVSIAAFGCNKDSGSGGAGGGGGGAAASTGGTGIKECDDYIAKYEGCFKNMDAITKAAAEPAFQAQRDAFKSAAAAATTPDAKAAVVTSCKQAMTSLASNPACK